MMLKRILLIALLLSAFALPGSALAAERTRVLLLPFTVHAQEEFQYLAVKIPELIGQHLQQEGAEILEIPDPSVQPLSEKEIRSLGIQAGADHVISGTLTWIQDRFSMDARVIRSFETLPAEVLITEGQGVENLLATVAKLARDIAIRLFQRSKVAEIRVEGNDRIEADAIARRIKTVAGDIFLAKQLSRDLKSVYAMGYFDDIRIESESGPDGKIVIFKVKEKPTIRHIQIRGNNAYNDEKLFEEITLKRGAILNIFRIRSDVQRMEALYKDKSYHNVRVEYEIKEIENNQADLVFRITEGSKVRIKEINFEGNVAFSGKKLKKVIESSEKGFLAWLTSSGELDPEKLDQDVDRIRALYHNNGYIQARAGEPDIRFEEEWIFITFTIVEGERFQVGEVALAGELILPDAFLRPRLKITTGEFYNRETIRRDVILLTDLFNDAGYAHAQIIPRIKTDDASHTVNIVYDFTAGPKVYFERIIISGNNKSRDKVIRRQMKVHEQGVFSGRLLKQSVRNLFRLEYFEDIKTDTIPGSADDKMVLKIDVTEKATGAVSFGGGYSSVENAFIMGSVSQSNLFGRGQSLQFKAQLGGRSTRYDIRFTEPWLFDIPLSAGFDLFNREIDYDTYDRHSLGGGLRFGYRIMEYTNLFLSYYYDISDVSGITADAARSIQELEGENTTSKVSTRFAYDSKDRQHNPSRGLDLFATVQYAGLGGDIGFTKYLAGAGLYIPLFKGTVGFIHGRTGFVEKLAGGLLPDYERFYLGGINSIRGFDWREIHALDSDGNDIGGNKYVQFNVEFIIPLFKEAGVVGVVFFDTGNVYDESSELELGDMRRSAGYGFRWFSPMGPIRVENGYILDPKEGESSSGRWEFTMGMMF